MTKLSKRISDPSMGCEVYEVAIWHWLKELAEYVEFIDRREQGLREEAAWKKKTQKVGGKHKYEPQTYDEAIGFCKGWPRAAFGYDVSWEKDKWPDLWKEMVEALHRGSMYLYESEWTFNLPAHQRYRDSTPGRVVCQAYLVYKGHADWAKRLSKEVNDAKR